MWDTIQIVTAMVVYLIAMILIGVYYARRANQDTEHYFLGGRSLGPWVTAMSAEASDMSGWLLMGLPGVAYWSGLADAFWTAVGLAIGTYINWLIVAKRLRRYSIVNQSITIPEFFSNRFREKKKVILGIAALFILVFFTVYTASCFVTFGKLFHSLFGLPYQVMMLVGAAVVLIYTFLGGFLAGCVSDFVQGIIMFSALVIVVVSCVIAGGGPAAILDNINSIPGFLEFFGIAQPEVVDGVQQVSAAGQPLFGDAGEYGILTVISTLSWGLGYFGVPQVLVRFMGIRKVSEIKKSRRIAIIWCFISLIAALAIGLSGRALFPTALNTAGDAESIFIVLSLHLLPPLLVGVVMAGILAATMSSSDSYLLITASAASKNLYQGIFKKDATDKQVMVMSRIALVVIAVFGAIIALDENSVIFTVVSFAWAGFGATFGPLMLFSLLWKRTTRAGAIAGMLSGAGVVFLWKLVLKPLGGLFGIYELFPAFVISCLVIVVVSLLTKKPSKEIEEDFEKAKTIAIE